MQSAVFGARTREAWQLAHVRLVELSRERAGLDLEEGRVLLEAYRQSVHRELGYGSFTEYVERLFGYAPRVTHDKLRVAEALERLPELSRELGAGKLSFSHARELTRVATPETEQIWLQSARGRTVREVEKAVSGRRPGALPDSPPEPEHQRYVIRFEVSGETLASFREAEALLRREAGEHLDDHAVLLLLARRALGGPIDDGRASYQVAVDVCERCQSTRQVTSGETVQLSRAAAAMVQCDAQDVSAHVGTTHNSVPPRATQDIPPATRRAVMRRDRGRCQVPGCAHSHFVDVHHVVARSEGGRPRGEQLGNLVRRPSPSSSRGDRRGDRQRGGRVWLPPRRRDGVRRSAFSDGGARANASFSGSAGAWFRGARRPKRLGTNAGRYGPSGGARAGAEALLSAPDETSLRVRRRRWLPGASPLKA